MVTLTYNIAQKPAITHADAILFVRLLRLQGKVQNPTVARVKACQRIIIVCSDYTPIGIGAIKRKTLSDFNPDKADLPGLAINVAFELGYIYVDPNYRGLGISNTMVKLLLMEFANTNLIATTELSASNPMLTVLLKSGFHQLGKSWKSQLSTAELGLFVRLKPEKPSFEGRLPTTIMEFQKLAKKVCFEEYPYIITGREPELSSLVDYEHADIGFRLYLTRLVLCRNFSPAGGYEVLTDHLWLIRSFLSDYTGDILKPWLTTAIHEALESVLGNAVFTRNLLGATFLFGIIEFYTKYLLGWRPNKADFFDDEAHAFFRSMFLGDAINKLKKQPLAISRDLNAIDKHCARRLKEREIPQERWVKASIADRLTVARNTMLHGEEHSFYSIGRYSAVLYILFHWHMLKMNGNHLI